MFRRHFSLRAAIEGKNVLLVGSSPEPLRCDPSAFDLVITANGSAGKLPSGMRPDFTVMTSQLLSDAISVDAWTRVAHAIGQKKATKGLISIRNGAHFEKRENASRFGYERDEVKTIRLGQMFRTLRRLTSSNLAGKAPNGLPSTGVLATALVFSLGAKAVHLDGFQLLMSKDSSESEHFYDEQIGAEGEKIPRYHSSADLLCLSSLAIRGFKISSDSAVIRSALQNWGDEGQTFFNPSLTTKVFWSIFAPW